MVAKLWPHSGQTTGLRVKQVSRVHGRQKTTYRIFKWTVLTCLFTKLELDWKPHSFPFASFQIHLDFPPLILWM